MGFTVTIEEGGSQTRHVVRMAQSTYQKLTNGSVSPADCIEAAFGFLLEREPKEAILAQFDIAIIKTYFPSFETDFARYLLGKE